MIRGHSQGYGISAQNKNGSNYIDQVENQNIRHNKYVVETGEGRTPRPENTDPEYTTGLANQLNSL